MKHVGVLYGMENTFPQALVARINELKQGVIAESVSIGVTFMAQPTKYDVIIDRISQDVPYYRSFLKNAMLNGTVVINNPFWWSADDKFFNYALMAKLGIAIPKTVLLPSYKHPPETTSQSFRNLRYPLEWKEVFEYVGFPAFLKPHSGGGWKHVYKVHNEGDFFHYYHQTGDIVMTLQEAIDFEEYYRCYCIGKEKVHIMRYDPKAPFEHRYVKPNAPPSPDLAERIFNDCLTICRTLGYDMNTIEFAVRDGVPYAIDFLNPAPDADYYSVGAENFSWMVDAMAEFAIKTALTNTGDIEELRWSRFLSGDLERTPAPQRATKTSKK